MTNTKPVAITALIKKLGYQNTSKLSDKVRETLEGKEHFQKYVLHVTKGGQRDEKYLIDSEAEILVDNIAFLHQYPYIFGKAKDSNEYPPFSKWVNGIDEAEFNVNLNKFKNRLEKTIERSEESLRSVNNFVTFVLANKKFDIEEKRLSSLVSTAKISPTQINTSRAFELGIWNELLELNEELEQGEETSLMYQKIGEKLIQLGDSEQAKEALESSLELDSENGVAWALLSIILYDKLVKANREYHSAMSLTDHSGEITHPISAEEHWINERVDETQTDYLSAEKEFVISAINALKHWPVWLSRPKVSSGEKNYTLCLTQNSDSEIKLGREQLFKNLVTASSFTSLSILRDDFIQVVRDFQSNDPDYYALTKIFYMANLSFKEAIFEKMRWISSEDESRAVLKLLEICEESGPFQDWPLQLLNNSIIQQSIMRLVGVTKYSELFDKLDDAQHHYKKQKKMDAMAKHQISEFLVNFTEILPKLRKLKNERFFESFNYRHGIAPGLEISNELQSELIAAFIESKKIALNWKIYAEFIDWNENSDYSNPISDELPTLVFLSLISLVLTEKEIKEETVLLLRKFIDNESVFKGVVFCIDHRLLNSLFIVELLEVNRFLEASLIQGLQNSILKAQDKLAEEESLEFE